MAKDKRESKTLYFQEGTSDKVYQVFLEPWMEEWAVNYKNGKRGSSLVTGTKTEDAVSYEEAKVIYDKLIAEKIKKGYKPGDDIPVEKPIKKLSAGKNFELFYHISNQGDGSAAVYFHKTNKEAEKADEKMDEGWGEPCNGSLSLRLVEGKLYYEDSDDDCKTIWIPVKEA